MLIRLVIFGAIALVMTGTACAKEYEIRLHRPARPGLAYRLTIRKTLTRDTTVKKTPPPGESRQDTGDGDREKPDVRRQESSLELDAVVTVRETDYLGNPELLALSVISFAHVSGDRRVELLSLGTNVTAQKKAGSPSFLVEGETPEPGAAWALTELVELEEGLSSSMGTLTSDDLFGTDAVASVGDSWPMRGDLLAEALAEEAEESGDRGGLQEQVFRGMLEKIGGKTTLDAVVRAGEMDCLRIVTETTIGETDSPEEERSFAYSAKAATLYPVDSSMGPLQEDSTETWTVTGRVPDGMMERVFERRTTRKLDYLGATVRSTAQ